MNWGLLGTVAVPVFSVLISVLTSAWVAIRSRQIDARSRREERVWQVKSEALKALIVAANDVRRVTRRTIGSADGDDGRAGEVAAIRALHQFHKKLGDSTKIGEVLAYAGEAVREPLDKMLDHIDVQERAHALPLIDLDQLQAKRTELVKEFRSSPVGDGASHTGADVMRQMSDVQLREAIAVNRIGRTASIELDEVLRLCDHLIDAAHLELRG